MPDQPNSPKCPVLGGMNGCQFFQKIPGWRNEINAHHADENQHDGKFDDHDGAIQVGGFLDPNDQNHGNGKMARKATRSK